MTVLNSNGIIDLEYYDSSIDEKYVMLFYFNGRPCFVDVRDDNRLSKTYEDYSDALIFKSNYSSELWDNPSKIEDLRNADWEHKIRPRIRPYIIGRTLSLPYSVDELSYFKSKEKPIHTLVSMTGCGITNKTTENRLSTYEFLQNNIANTNLIFWLRKHGVPNEEILESIQIRAKKFNTIPILGLNEYFNFLALGKYSLNIPGITCSQPFRCVDAVLSNRVVISTKIWQDIYTTFPALYLPIDTYFNTGNWEEAKIILQKIDNFPYEETLRDSKFWYSWYLSPEGFWKNQILKQLE
jgi:hypothetical protein